MYTYTKILIESEDSTIYRQQEVGNPVVKVKIDCNIYNRKQGHQAVDKFFDELDRIGIKY